MMKMSGDGYNCSVIQDNGSVVNLTSPAFTTDGSISALVTTTGAPAQTTNIGGVITGGCFTTPIVILPIDLIYFDGYGQDEDNVLVWSTASEINNDFYEIEQSQDAVNWKSVGKVNAEGNTINSRDYSLIDEVPFAPITYYRLKQVDFNGQYKYSDIISITHDKNLESTYSIFPNPTNDVIRIKNNHLISKNTYVEIHNAIGEKVFTRELNPEVFIHSIPVKELLNQGIYFVSIYENTKKIVTQKLIIQ